MRLKFQYTLFYNFLLFLSLDHFGAFGPFSQKRQSQFFCEIVCHKINLIGGKYDLDLLKLKRVYRGPNM